MISHVSDHRATLPTQYLKEDFIGKVIMNTEEQKANGGIWGISNKLNVRP